MNYSHVDLVYILYPTVCINFQKFNYYSFLFINYLNILSRSSIYMDTEAME